MTDNDSTASNQAAAFPKGDVADSSEWANAFVEAAKADPLLVVDPAAVEEWFWEAMERWAAVCASNADYSAGSYP